MTTTGVAATTMEPVVNELCPRSFNGYGVNEAGLTLLLHPSEAIRRLGSSSKQTLISECRIIVHNPYRDLPPDELVKSGEVGQLIARGPLAMKGYWANSVETNKKLRHGWIYMGDPFNPDGDGFYFFRGRADDMIVSGGENIYPSEIEAIHFRAPGVQEAAVIGVLEKKWGQIVTAYVVRADDELTADTLAAFFQIKHGSRDLQVAQAL